MIKPKWNKPQDDKLKSIWHSNKDCNERLYYNYWTVGEFKAKKGGKQWMLIRLVKFGKDVGKSN